MNFKFLTVLNIFWQSLRYILTIPSVTLLCLYRGLVLKYKINIAKNKEMRSSEIEVLWLQVLLPHQKDILSTVENTSDMLEKHGSHPNM